MKTMFWNNSLERSNGSYQENMDLDDKENNDAFQKLASDASLYENSISTSSVVSCSSFEEGDPNSLDSGYGVSNISSPLAEEFLDISSLTEDDSSQLPGDFEKLIRGSLVQNQPHLRTCNTFNVRRSISLIETPNTSRARSCLFKDENSPSRALKRLTSSPQKESPKRTKVLEDIKNVVPMPLHRSISSNEDRIKIALHRSSTEPDLIGDFSKAFCLPLTSGRHQDLKSITPTTLAMLIRGQFNQNVGSFKVIDCRYPYEFEGGHIAGAMNFYTKQQIIEELMQVKTEQPSPSIDPIKRQILVFHCEFSSERGPNLSRFLRSIDRTQNKDTYPFLHYPEIYLLDGGYKNFFEQYSDLCMPYGYLPMLHPNHEEDLRHFRAKSRTFNCDTRQKSNKRSSLYKRL